MNFELTSKGKALGARHLSLSSILLLSSALMVTFTVSAQNIKRIPLPRSQNPSNAHIPFSAAVWVGDTLYVSGWLDPDRKTHTDTESQTVGILKDLQKFLASQNLTLGDVVMMREYLQGNSATGGKADYLGARAGYSQFFGTKDQPNGPASTAVQVVLPAAGSGALVEIDLIVVRPK